MGTLDSFTRQSLTCLTGFYARNLAGYLGDPTSISILFVFRRGQSVAGFDILRYRNS